MKYIIIALLLLGGCSFNLSFGTTTQQIRSKWICADAAMQALQMSQAYRTQAALATTDEERNMTNRIADGFMNDYRELSTKEQCWVKP